MRVSNTSGLHIDRLKMLVYGASGSGKTTLAGTITEPTVIVSAEAGLLPLAGKDIDVLDITVDDKGNLIPRHERMRRLAEVYHYLVSEEARRKYRWVFIDSLTEIAECLLAELDRQYPDPKHLRIKYGEYGKKLRSTIISFRDMPWYNVVFTALQEIKTDDNSKRYVEVDIAGKTKQKLPQFFDLVFHLTVIEGEDKHRVLETNFAESTICKDRSNALLAQEQPDLNVIAGKIRGKHGQKKEAAAADKSAAAGKTKA